MGVIIYSVVLFCLSLSQTKDQKVQTMGQYRDSSYIVPKNPLPVLIRTNSIVKEPTMNWWWFYSGSFMKIADSSKYSKSTTNQEGISIFK
jgi:hypothetical protein